MYLLFWAAVESVFFDLLLFFAVFAAFYDFLLRGVREKRFWLTILFATSENLSFFSLSKISEITFFTSLFIASFAFSSPSCSFSILPLSIFSDYRNISIVLSTSYLEISYFSSSSLKASSRKFLSFIVSCSFFTFWVSFSAIRFLRSAIFGKSFCLRKLLSKMF